MDIEQEIQRHVSAIKGPGGIEAGVAAHELGKLLGIQAIESILSAVEFRYYSGDGLTPQDIETRTCVGAIVVTLSEMGQPAVVPLVEFLDEVSSKKRVPNFISAACAVNALMSIGSADAQLAAQRFHQQILQQFQP